MTREIGFLIYPNFQLLDLTGPLDTFRMVAEVTDREPYAIEVVSPAGGSIASSCGVKVSAQPFRPKAYDTFFVVGGGLPTTTPGAVARSLRNAANTGAQNARRVASVCTGAFILASAGLLDGRRATTHWKYAVLLQRQYPRVRVHADRLFTNDRNIWTSGGVSSGIDLALALIEEDLGIAISKATARMLLAYHTRPGSQSQFSTRPDVGLFSDRVRDVLTYMRQHLEGNLSLAKLSEVAGLGPRQFGRAFFADTGETPAKAVERLRAESARQRVENGSEPIEVIAREVGFSDPARMRRAFLRTFGHPPQSLRRRAVQEQRAADLKKQSMQDLAIPRQQSPTRPNRNLRKPRRSHSDC